MKFRIGDKVVAIDEDFTGMVISVKNNEVEIETSDGFVMLFTMKELIKLDDTLIFEQGALKQNDMFYDKKKSDLSPKKSLQFKTKTPETILEVDLHIEKLVKNHKRLSNFEILTLQTETAQRQIEFAITKKIPKMVFIHGVGEGILKSELEFLFKKYDKIIFKDADYRKYGQGATEIYFKQSSK